jgi:hypothetical protein
MPRIGKWIALEEWPNIQVFVRRCVIFFPLVMRHTSRLSAVSSHILRSTSSSSLIIASLIMSRSSLKDCGRRGTLFLTQPWKCKSRGVWSGDRGGHLVDALWPTHLSADVISRKGVWPSVRRVLWRDVGFCSWGITNISVMSIYEVRSQYSERMTAAHELPTAWWETCTLGHFYRVIPFPICDMSKTLQTF